MRKAYQTTKYSIPPYPDKSIRKWFFSVEGVKIENGVVQLVSTNNQGTEFHQQVHANSHCCGTATQSRNRRNKTPDGTSDQPDKGNKQKNQCAFETLNSRGGKIELHALIKSYQTTKYSISPYPDNSIRKWICSVEGVKIENWVVQLVYANKQATEFHQQVHANSHCCGTATQSRKRRNKTPDGTSAQPEKGEKQAKNAAKRAAKKKKTVLQMIWTLKLRKERRFVSCILD